MMTSATVARRALTPTTPSKPRRSRGLLGNADTRVKALALLGGAVVWQVLGMALGLSWLPSFTEVIHTLGRLIENGEVFSQLLSTLLYIVLGFVIASIAGIVLGVLIGRFRRVEQALMLYVNLMLFTPSLIFAPIYLALFGLSGWTRIAIVVHFSIFVIIVNAASGIRSVSAELVEMSHSYGAGNLQTMFRVLLPGATLMVFAGLRIGLGLAVKGAIMGEMYISAFGLGGVVHKYGGQFDASAVLAVSIVIALLGLALRAVLLALEKYFTRWDS